MKFETFKNERTNTQYIRVNRKIANRAFNCGSTVLIAPVNVNPNFWSGSLVHYCNIDYNDFFVANQFDRVCNSIIYYNCNSELGRYLKYFLTVNVALKYGYKE